MAILLIEVPFKVAGGWLEYNNVCLWWAVGRERSVKSRGCIYRGVHQIEVYELPVRTA